MCHLFIYFILRTVLCWVLPWLCLEPLRQRTISCSSSAYSHWHGIKCQCNISWHFHPTPHPPSRACLSKHDWIVIFKVELSTAIVWLLLPAEIGASYCSNCLLALYGHNPEAYIFQWQYKERLLLCGTCTTEMSRGIAFCRWGTLGVLGSAPKHNQRKKQKHVCHTRIIRTGLHRSITFKIDVVGNETRAATEFYLKWHFEVPPQAKHQRDFKVNKRTNFKVKKFQKDWCYGRGGEREICTSWSIWADFT